MQQMSLKMDQRGNGPERPRLPSINQIFSNYDHENHSVEDADQRRNSLYRVEAQRRDSIQKTTNRPQLSSLQFHREDRGRLLMKEGYQSAPNFKPGFVFPQPPPLPHYSTYPPQVPHQSDNLTHFQPMYQVGGSHERNISLVDTNEISRSLYTVSKDSRPVMHTNTPFFQGVPSTVSSGEIPHHHRKSSSLNSIDTLSQAVTQESQLAVKGPTEREVKLVRKIEEFTKSAQLIEKISQEVEKDMVEHSTQTRNGSQRSIKIDIRNGGVSAFMNDEAVKHFLSNIPVQLLTETIQRMEGMMTTLKKWRDQRLGVDENERGKLFKKRKSVADIDSLRQERVGDLRMHHDERGLTLRRERESADAAEGYSRFSLKGGTKALKSKQTQKHLGLNEELSITRKIVCVQCGETETPEWRRGPYGVRTLCNACGLFHGKLTKKFGVTRANQIMSERKRSGQGADRRIPNTE